MAQCDSSKPLDLCPFRPDDVGISVSVTNTGEVESDFVLLAFIAGDFGPEPGPLKTLAAYTRIQDLKAGGAEVADLGRHSGWLGQAR